MSKHTEGKWVVREQENSFTIGQECNGGKLIAETAPFFSYLGVAAKETARENARRMVACVNALEGLTTEQIEDGVFQKMREDRDFLSAEVDALTKQRDELLDVLELAVEQMESDSIQIESEWGCGRDIDELDEAGELPEAILKARAFIAKAKGGAVNHFPDAAKMVTDGWQLVPVEPTIEMISAATHNSVGFGTRAAYQAMLAAAPKLEGGAK